MLVAAMSLAAMLLCQSQPAAPTVPAPTPPSAPSTPDPAAKPDGPASVPAPAPRKPAPSAKPPEAAPPVPFPHPLITEVLYAVPTGDEGDADGDGIRSATGDEFIELINPHTKPIRLKGYILTDGRNLLPSGGTSRNARREPPAGTRNAPKGQDSEPKESTDRKTRIRFEFPDITLQPGQVVVVFNGFKGKNSARVTDPAAGGASPAAKPTRPVPGSGSAPIILSMGVTSQYAALANTGDCVLLLDPKGNGIHCIAWGEKTKPPEDAAPLLERAPESRGSVTRIGLARGLGEHPELDPGRALFSPGLHDLQPSPAETTPGEVPPLDSKPPNTDAGASDSPKEPAGR